MKLNSATQLQIDKLSEVTRFMWDKGWSERNAGNVSVNLTDLVTDTPTTDRYVEKAFRAEAANMYFYVSGTGEHLRDVATKPNVAGAIIKIDHQAKGYYIVWGGESGANFKVTSEFASHLSIHLDYKKHNKPHKCVIHTHPIELIAISHHPQLGQDEPGLNKALWSMLPEVRVFVPKGVAIAPYELPGSQKIANLTVNGLKRADVVLWSKHGVVATGADAVEAFDFIDVANKGALIYLMCLQSGFVPMGMTDAEMKELEQFI